jgi:hypothetical protein
VSAISQESGWLDNVPRGHLHNRTFLVRKEMIRAAYHRIPSPVRFLSAALC